MKKKRDELADAAARLPVGKKDHDACPEIARCLREQRAVEILHEESGVRVWARFWGGQDYSLEVPVACLDSRSGQRHRAKGFIQDAGYRAYDADLGPVPDVGEGRTWGYSRNQGGAKEAANQALRLLCEIAELPIDVRVRVEALAENPDDAG